MDEPSPEPGLTGMPTENERIIARANERNSGGWSPYPIPDGPHPADRSSAEDLQARRRQEIIRQHRADIMVFTGPPRQSAPPAARAHDDDNRVVISLFATFRTGAGHPKARIQHGRAGDDMLMRYYLGHDTLNGAEVYIEPNVCHNAAARAHDDYYKVDTRRTTFLSEARYPIAQIEHVGGEEHYFDNELKRYYFQHYTFAGAMVCIKPNMDSEQED